MDNIVGSVIGIYSVLGICDYRSNDGHKLYKVKCIYCGKEFIMKLSNIKKASNCTHNKKKWNLIPMSNVYNKMIKRCYDKTDKDYKYYGGKGIVVCDEWLINPNSFEDWAINSGYKKGLSIDRIDPQIGYCPENCRWISMSENSRRAGKVNWITVGKETLTGRQWAEKLGLTPHIFNDYIRKCGLNTTKELISKIIKNPDLLQTRQRNQSLIKLYHINII